MEIEKVCILGGSGFLGRTLCNRLAQDDLQLRILSRNREKHRRDLIVLPKADLVQCDVHDEKALRQALEGCQAAINLVGILNERGRDGSGFRKVHVELNRKLAAACRAAGVRRLLYVSALNAGATKARSHYLRSKGEAEKALLQDPRLQTSIYRPSVIFGRDDSFLNRFQKLLRLTLGLPFPLACAGAKFAPVWVEDIAEAMARTLPDVDAAGRIYELCGPQIYTLRQLVQYVAAQSGMRRWIVPLGSFLSRIQAAVFDFVPGKPFSTDNYFSAQLDSVAKHNHFSELGITPTSLEAVAPSYLGSQSGGSQGGP